MDGISSTVLSDGPPDISSFCQFQIYIHVPHHHLSFATNESSRPDTMSSNPPGQLRPIEHCRQDIVSLVCSCRAPRRSRLCRRSSRTRQRDDCCWRQENDGRDHGDAPWLGQRRPSKLDRWYVRSPLECNCPTSTRVLGRLRDVTRAATATVSMHFVQEHYGYMVNWSPAQTVNHFLGKIDHYFTVFLL